MRKKQNFEDKVEFLDALLRTRVFQHTAATLTAPFSARDRRTESRVPGSESLKMW